MIPTAGKLLETINEIRKTLPKCSKILPGYQEYYYCNRNGRYEHEGKYYCGQHHPPRIEKWRQRECKHDPDGR